MSRRKNDKDGRSAWQIIFEHIQTNRKNCVLLLQFLVTSRTALDVLNGAILSNATGVSYKNKKARDGDLGH